MTSVALMTVASSSPFLRRDLDPFVGRDRTLSPAIDRRKSPGNPAAEWSERNPRGQDDIVVEFLMIRHRDLVAAAERQADAVVNRNPPDQ